MRAKKNKSENGTGRPKKFTVAQFIQAVEGSGGLRTQIAERLNCSLNTVASYIRDYLEIQKAIEDEETKVLDMAEGALFSLIQGGDTSAIFYYLNNKGRKRGYAMPNRQILIQHEDEGEKERTGVLVTPGILEEALWEKAARENPPKEGREGASNAQ